MMTIEEKAKAYDEAISRAKNSYGTGAYDDATTEFIFPELSEGEDERIRKILIDAFEKKNNSFIDEFVDCRLTKADILAYLEKQKDLIDSKVDDEDERIRKAIQYAICQSTHGDNTLIDGVTKDEALALLKKQKELKPIQPNINREHIEERLRVLINKKGEYYRGAREELAHLFCILGGQPSQYLINNVAKGEQKPAEHLDDKLDEEVELTPFESALFSAFSDAWQEFMRGENVNVAQWAKEHSEELLEVAKEDSAKWSKEEKEIIGNLRHILNAYAFEHSGLDVNGDYIEQDYIDADNWLKSLRERVNLQPKQEWSEEDEKRLNRISWYLTHKGYKDDADWLKSLLPSWKPSEEYIEWLCIAKNMMGNRGQEVLGNLIAELEKMM